MTTKEVRDIMVEGLHGYLGLPVRLSDQTVSESEYPYLYYQSIAPYIPRGGANISRHADTDDDATLLTRREEISDATYSFSACSRNRNVNGDYVFGDDEAMALAEKAQGWFLHAGRGQLRAKGIAVVEVYNVANRSGIEVDEIDRRWGFDVRLRYKRVDDRRDPAIDNGTIKER